MPNTLFTPRQVATALGVSESSVKRWVDAGKLVAGKTVGGHRKVTLSSVAQFVRASGQSVAHPDLIGLVSAKATASSLHEAVKPMFEGLISGREAFCRASVLGPYQGGASVVELGDDLIGPAFKLVGDGWAAGSVTVHEERQACETIITVLHELRRWVPDALDDAPVAVVATPAKDFALVPLRLVELALRSAGWRVVAAGSGLPLEEIVGSIRTHAARLACVSATHLEDPAGFLRDYREVLVEPTRREWGVAHALGGTALSSADLTSSGADLAARSLADLDVWQASLRVV
ncbi:MAG: helix-turn-helix domain-containing protein [Lacipirellulaceae bacterium]